MHYRLFNHQFVKNKIMSVQFSLVTSLCTRLWRAVYGSVADLWISDAKMCQEYCAGVSLVVLTDFRAWSRWSLASLAWSLDDRSIRRDDETVTPTWSWSETLRRTHSLLWQCDVFVATRPRQSSPARRGSSVTVAWSPVSSQFDTTRSSTVYIVAM